MADNFDNSLSYSGELDIKQLRIVAASGSVVDLYDYLVELNIFEDIFSNFLYGNMQLSDSRNLISLLPILGEEYFYVDFETPSLGTSISKVFKIYSITDRKNVRDNNTQLYTLHFCSLEAIADSVTTLYNPFKGKISEVVGQIYEEFLELPRRILIENGNNIKESEDTTPLYILNESKNDVKFVSPGWSPAKCINWLCTKTLPEEGKVGDYLFWETTQGFYFGNIEKLFIDLERSNFIKGIYTHYPPDTRPTKEIINKLFVAEDFEHVKTNDNLQNVVNGYLANRIVTFDFNTKRYDYIDYDHILNFNEFKHSSGKNSAPLFAENSLRNSSTNVRFYPIQKNNYDDLKNNVSLNMPSIYGPRLSRMLELNNNVINITVPGRTDMEAGCLIGFVYPDTTAKDSRGDNAQDPRYSGVYLVSAIRHKINLKKHVMIMELVKDSIMGQS